MMKKKCPHLSFFIIFLFIRVSVCFGQFNPALSSSCEIDLELDYDYATAAAAALLYFLLLYRVRDKR